MTITISSLRFRVADPRVKKSVFHKFACHIGVIFCRPAAVSILMPPTFHIASLNCYTPKFCILRGVRILLSNCTEISATSETLSSVVPLAIFYKSACRFKSLEIHRRACTRCSMQNCRCKINHACWSRTHVCVHYVLNNQTIHQKFDHDRQGTPTSSKSFVNFLFMIYSIWQCDIVKNLY